MAPTRAPSRSLILLLTFAAGTSVANLYYNQPLLPEIAASFHAAPNAAGLIATLTQVGYAVGLLLFVPLGDIVERRRLIVVLLVAVAAALAAAALSPTLGLLTAASFAIGVTTVVPQLVIPFAAGLAPPESRGRVVGQVVGGVLIGVLAGRVVAGAVAHLTGWRSVFGDASVAMLVLAAAMWRLLPLAPPVAERMPYRTLLRSLVTLVREQPVIRDTSITGALTFASFSVFWTTLAFRLRTAPLDYGSGVAGAFGLLGVIGAAAAPLAGRLADRRSPRETVGYALLVNIAAWGVFLVAGHTLLGIAAGVLLLDAGTQAAQVSNQARIYALPAETHGRLNTIYMVCYFVGGALGSALGSAVWGSFGWRGVCGLGGGVLVVAFARHWFSAPDPSAKT
ncbi:MAG: transporter [Gemmatimonadetes bacterium]|jgi:predicted MFS family arabinose efflux permease|nr:transporter [Gemmatimonadota bacterium]